MSRSRRGSRSRLTVIAAALAHDAPRVDQCLNLEGRVMSLRLVGFIPAAVLLCGVAGGFNGSGAGANHPFQPAAGSGRGAERTRHEPRSVLAAHGDPFAGPSTLDHSTKRKLELYQQLFYLLQIHSDYLARLFYIISKTEAQEKTKKLLERVVPTLFAFGQNRREEYLLIKFLQVNDTPTFSNTE